MAIKAQSRGFLFDSVKISDPKRSAFDLSFENKLSLNLGDLVPIMCKEILPGDVVELRTSLLAKFTPTLAPIMHKVDMFVYSFFVPNRLIWDNWQEFISPGDGKVLMKDMASYKAPIWPHMNVGVMQAKSGSSGTLYNSLTGVGSLADYLGYNRYSYDSETVEVKKINFSTLPFRAYQLVYNEYFRDQNLQEPVYCPKQDGDDYDNVTANASVDGEQAQADKCAELFTLRKKCWEKDYFTSALPSPQRGGTVYLPLGGECNITYDEDKLYDVENRMNDTWGQTTSVNVNGAGPGLTGADFAPFNNKSTSSDIPSRMQGVEIRFANQYQPDTKQYVKLIAGTGKDFDGNNQSFDITIKEPYPTMSNGSFLSDLANSLKADLSSATSVSIETLRSLFKLQEWLEKQARGGARYIESLLSHWGVQSSDARLQRPELLDGCRIPVTVSEVVQQSETTENSVQGTKTGELNSFTAKPFVKRRFEEHGFLLTLVSIIPRTAYQQGLSRMFTRPTYLDYAWPEFAHLGEQEVYTRELYNNGSDKVFGYQPRYSEYKYNPDEVHGDFKTNLDFWHMGRKFDIEPTLSKEFVISNPTTRIFPVIDEDVQHIYLDCWNDFKVIRALPMYGTPTF